MIRLLYTVTILELFLGGGGRVLDFGPITIRMILFVPCTLVGLYLLFVRPRATEGQMLAVYLMLAYLVVHLAALLNGFIRGAEPADIFKEIQQSTYWLAAPFFAWILQSVTMVKRTASLAQIAGVILGLAYGFILIGTALGFIDFISLYKRMRETGELVGRGEGIFVYKGFLYLGIAMVFLVALRARYWKSLTLVVFAALIMTLTRGFILAAVVAVLLMLMVQESKRAVAAGLITAAVAVFLVWVYLPSTNEQVADNRELSNGQRIADATYIVDHATPETFIFGQGYGSLINDRANIENTFLWAFWKLGMAGVVFWLLPLVLCTYYFHAIPRDELYGLACGYYFGVIFVYVQTATNPYLNNPIGQSFVMAAIFSLRTLAARRAEQAAPASSAAGVLPHPSSAR